MTGSDIMNKLLEYSTMNPKKFSEKIGLGRPQAIYDIQNGKTKNISPGMADKIISVFPEIDRGWLLTGVGDMLKNTSSQKTEEVPAEGNAATMISIPQSVWAVIENQAASLKAKDEQVNRLITQIEESNSILKTTILGTYTGFPAAPTDLGVKNPPPIKSELK